MKHLFLFLLLLCFCGTSYAQLNYHIEVSFADPYNNAGSVKDGDVVKLEHSFDDVKKEAVVKEGRAVFTGTVAEPTVAMFNYKRGGVKLLLDGSSYRLALTVKKEGDSFTYDAKIETSSAFHNLWSEFYINRGKQNNRKRELLDKVDSSPDEQQAKALRRELALLDLEILESFKTVTLKNPDNHAVAYFMGDAPDFSYKNYIGIYNALDDDVKQSYLGQRLLGKLKAVKSMSEAEEAPTSSVGREYIGQKVPEIGGMDVTGKSVTLGPKSLTSNYTLIEFWASWCGPCRKINIDMRAKYPEYRKKGLEIVGFSLDADAENWKKAVEKDNTGWLQISDLKAGHSPVAQFFNLNALPANVVVDQNGIIVAMDVYGEALERLLQ
ncbi:TlpA family protein disulfide reductase [Pontibacter sp. HSC-14F20]|uniref:peroxiredoxin family protein n=1 Tax=Pontibacter sp. HSC-14F20 TaxID=2864136 RepID=UPI001C73B282|nr:TlpA disulfide reductase family protein [Pontibacter sp. HSC-14F20]MBX0334287.1 TlpA family protein disulfide reductase [Pontibacter sp. HSC-14F20]